MSLPSSHVLPQSSFTHIGIMVTVMSFIASLSVVGYMNIQTITNAWFADIDDVLTLEIPSYDPDNQEVLTQKDIDQNVQEIQKAIENDPVIESFHVKTADGNLLAEAEALSIPLPVFITLRLNSERADNAEDRLISLLKQSVPTVRIQQTEDWQKDIERMALNLKLLFGAMALCVIIVTVIIIASTIRIQLKANQYVIELVHLMGAHAGMIAGIFQRSILLPLCFGCIVGLGMAFILLFYLLSLMQMELNLNYLMIITALLFLIFSSLGIIVTRWTVVRALWRMP
jgi:cell division transport system permease protein